MGRVESRIGAGALSGEVAMWMGRYGKNQNLPQRPVDLAGRTAPAISGD